MPSEYDDAIRRCIDEQLAIERKAAAWDELYRLMTLSQEPVGQRILALMDEFVHPARGSST
jgi:hypothetical protein